MKFWNDFNKCSGRFPRNNKTTCAPTGQLETIEHRSLRLEQYKSKKRREGSDFAFHRYKE